jgi:hypothetical protein
MCYDEKEHSLIATMLSVVTLSLKKTSVKLFIELILKNFTYLPIFFPDYINGQEGLWFPHISAHHTTVSCSSNDSHPHTDFLFQKQGLL